MKTDLCVWIELRCVAAHLAALSSLLGFFFSLSQMRKPLIERKRRERINHCLDQLKETVIDAFRLDVSTQPRDSPPHDNRLRQLHVRNRLSTAIQVGKGRYSGDDSETFAEHPGRQTQW